MILNRSWKEWNQSWSSVHEINYTKQRRTRTWRAILQATNMMTSRQERKKIWDQIKRLSSKLDAISSQVDRISQAIDSSEMYRYQYNQYNTIKIVDIPQVAETEPPEDTPSICLKLYSHALEQIPQIRISTWYTRFRQNQLRPADRILLFVNLSGDYLKRSHVGNKSD